MNKLNRKGVGGVAVLIILLVVGVLSFAGWKVWESKSAGTASEQNLPQSNSGTENKKAHSTEAEKVATGVVIKTGDSKYGTMLFNDAGQAIYIWQVEDSSEAKCYDDCAEAWPPVLTDGAPRATGSVNKALLGTTKRTDGSTQVTYNGHPLYYYAHEGPGEVTCHNVSEYGGLWWVIQPNGIRAN